MERAGFERDHIQREDFERGQMQRVWVVGSSGSGKSTVGRRLADLLGYDYVELDAIHHQPGWVELDRVSFRTRIEPLVHGDRWVIDGNYAKVADLIVARADTVVWLDLPRALVMRRLVLRTAVRGLTRAELWNGNKERLANLFRLDPAQSVVRWAWVHWEEYQDRYGDLQRSFEGRFVRLRSDAAVDDFLTAVAEETV